MTRIAVIFTPDNAIDADFWRWTPAGATLHFTRTPLETFHAKEEITWVPSDHELVQGTRNFTIIEPEVTVFACTSGSFARGLAGERKIRETIESAGAKKAITTSGSVLDALTAVGAKKVAVAT